MKRSGWHSVILSLSWVFLILFVNPSWAGIKPLSVAVTRVSPNYMKWLKRADSTIVLVDMNSLSVKTALEKMESCAGLLLTGGEDVEPSCYGRPDLIKYCQETNPKRDSLEIALIQKALSLKMPVFGICRGEQILNVALGGTLIPDIPVYMAEEGKNAEDSLKNILTDDNQQNVIHQCKDYLQCFHTVTVVPVTFLSSVISPESGSVASNHHQAVQILAPGIQCNARSGDGLVEGIEWEKPENKSFLMGVQWHPERMDEQNEFSSKLAAEFYNQMMKFKESQ